MLPHNLEIIIALAIPFVVLMMLKINAAMVFMSLCVGYVLVELVAKDTDSLINFLTSEGSISQTTLQIGMLFLPAVLTCIFTVFSVKGRMRALLNVFPALGVSAMVVLMTVPLFTPGLRNSIQSQGLWPQLHDAQALIVGATAFVSLLILWTQRHHSGKRHESRK